MENHVYDENIIEKLKYKVQIKEKENGTKSGKADNSQVLLDYIDDNRLLIQSFHFMKSFKIDRYCKNNTQKEVDIFNQINVFIVTGMLELVK